MHIDVRSKDKQYFSYNHVISIQYTNNKLVIVWYNKHDMKMTDFIDLDTIERVDISNYMVFVRH